MRMNWSELEDAFISTSPECRYFLLPETGEILFLSEGLEEDEQAEIEDRLDSTNFVEIEPPESHEKWRWMAAFAETVQDEHLRELLEVALQGKGAFRRFKDVLLRSPAERERWFRYETEAMHEAIDRWVAGHSIEVENPPPWGQSDAHE